MKKMMIIVTMVMMLMPIGAQAHEVCGTITFEDVVDEIEKWNIEEEYEEHIVSSKTEIDYTNETYLKEYVFDDDCEYSYAIITVSTVVRVDAMRQDGEIESARWDFDEFAEEFFVWSEE